MEAIHYRREFGLSIHRQLLRNDTSLSLNTFKSDVQLSFQFHRDNIDSRVLQQIQFIGYVHVVQHDLGNRVTLLVRVLA